MNNTPGFHYITAGTLPANALSYIKRKADDEIYEALKEGNYCYIFNCRQMGKSSTENSVRHRLAQEGWATAYFPVSKGGIENISAEQWYYQMLEYIANGDENDENNYTKERDRCQKYDNLDLAFDFKNWWNKKKDFYSYENLFKKFITEIILNKLPNRKILITFDEIDSILQIKSGFSCNDFFAVIRELYNSRVNNPSLNNIHFCILGVATPRDLSTDKIRTPFNIGNKIELTGFTPEEAEKGVEKKSKGLLTGLQGKVDNPSAVLKEIIRYTGGQPYLTQKLCRIVSKANNLQPNIKQLILKQIINLRDDNLNHIQERIEELKVRSPDSCRLALETYLEILQNPDERIPVNPKQEEINGILKLAGLVVEQTDRGVQYLKVFNWIYKTRYSPFWVRDSLTELNNLPPTWFIKKYQLWDQIKDEFNKLYFLLNCQEHFIISNQKDQYPFNLRQEKYRIESEAKIKEYQFFLTVDDSSNRFRAQKNLTRIIIDCLIVWTNRHQKLIEELIKLVPQYFFYSENAIGGDLENITPSKIDEMIKYYITKSKYRQLINQDRANNLDNETRYCSGIHSIIQQIKDKIKKKENLKERFDLIVTYGQILLNQNTDNRILYSNQNQKHKDLLNIGLIREHVRLNQPSCLQVANPIYEKVFNLEKNDFELYESKFNHSYIEEQLAQINLRNINTVDCNYSQKLGMWLITKENQYLLSQVQASDIINGLEGEQLSPEEHKYLTTSMCVNFEL